MLSDLPMLKAAVLENPRDDAPRLIYADALEEEGFQDLASFIRWGCLEENRGRILWDHQDAPQSLVDAGLKDFWDYHRSEMSVYSRGWNRGLLSSLHIRRPVDWLDDCDKLLSAHPIQEVRFNSIPYRLHVVRATTGRGYLFYLQDLATMKHWLIREAAQPLIEFHKKEGEMPDALVRLALELEWPGIHFLLDDSRTFYRQFLGGRWDFSILESRAIVYTGTT